MKLLRKQINHYPVGIWIAFLSLTLIIFAWFMQIYSLFDWEGAVKLGIQDESFTGDFAERAIADVERGIAIADILWALPITIVAVIGLLDKKLIGFVASMMVFSVCVYFPLFYAFRESTDPEIVLFALLIWALPSIIGIYCLWVNRELFNTN